MYSIFRFVPRPTTISCVRHLKINTRIPRSRPDLLRFLEDIALPVLEKPLPDPVEDCYREHVKQKILLDQEDIELASEYDQFRARRFREMLESSRTVLLCQEICIVPSIRYTIARMQFLKNGFQFMKFPRIVPHLALANNKQYENFLPPILSFGFETIYLFHKDNNLASAFKLLKKYRNNLLLIGGLVDGRLYNRAGLEALNQLPNIDYFQGELVSITQLPGSRTLSLANHPARLLSHYLDTYMAGSALRRLIAEYKQLTNNPPDGILAGPISDENFFEWEALITGPSGTSFEYGVFVTRLHFPSDYPLSPPKMKFVSEIFHPNVYPDGRVCISILHAPGDDPMGYETSAERWSPVQSIEKILLSVVSLLAEPNEASPANVDAAKMFRENREKFDETAKRSVRKTLGL
ncbi:unnamed protein product [Adineta ricciae]|uniref:Ubiquitin-conjugating enzyme E2 G2 n=1 Tax=Adineta ricciae TaxID=249248 RepID=A0A814GLJ9_ADIRI|nr:unnamed protein product [Adineta ricciae]